MGLLHDEAPPHAARDGDEGGLSVVIPGSEQLAIALCQAIVEVLECHEHRLAGHDLDIGIMGNGPKQRGRKEDR